MVIRRTQVISEKIQDLTIKGGDIADRTDAVGISGSAKLMKYSIGSTELGSTLRAVGSENIGTILPTEAVVERAVGVKVLTRGKLSYLETFGSAVLSKAGTYIPYGVTYTVAPYPSLTKIDSWSEDTYPTRVASALVGSMFAYGSEGGYTFWRCVGSA